MTRKGTPAVSQRSPRKKASSAWIRHHIVRPHPTAIASYLRSHRALGRILPAICEQARREFGPTAQLTLDVYHDPEIDDRHLTLCVRVPCNGTGAIIERLDRVTAPFADELCRASGYLLVTTDFQPPEHTHSV
jgi:hypothetical protein